MEEKQHTICGAQGLKFMSLCIFKKIDKKKILTLPKLIFQLHWNSKLVMSTSKNWFCFHKNWFSICTDTPNWFLNKYKTYYFESIIHFKHALKLSVTTLLNLIFILKKQKLISLHTKLFLYQKNLFFLYFIINFHCL